MSDILLKLSVPKFVMDVPLSKKRRKKYYKRLKDLPSNWNRENYYEKGGRVYKVEDDSEVLKNAGWAGKPRVKRISGNLLWSGGKAARFARQKATDLMKSHIFKCIKNQNLQPIPIENFPVFISWGIWLPPSGFDLSNLWFHYKMIEDCLRDKKIIPEDNIGFVSGLKGPIYFYAKSEAHRKIEIIIRKDNRQDICNKTKFLRFSEVGSDMVH